jgi:hypothetical protein
MDAKHKLQFLVNPIITETTKFLANLRGNAAKKVKKKVHIEYANE